MQNWMFVITFKVGGEIKGLSKLTSDVREELLVEIKWDPINLYWRSNEYLYLRSSGPISLSWISLFGIKCANVFILFNLSERIFKCGNIFIWVRFHLSERILVPMRIWCNGRTAQAKSGWGGGECCGWNKDGDKHHLWRMSWPCHLRNCHSFHPLERQIQKINLKIQSCSKNCLVLSALPPWRFLLHPTHIHITHPSNMWRGPKALN